MYKKREEGVVEDEKGGRGRVPKGQSLKSGRNKEEKVKAER